MKLIYLLLVICYMPCMAGDNVIILNIFPYSEDGNLKGYITISKDRNISSPVKFFITKCDVNMNPLVTVEEERSSFDEITSFAYNKSAFCIVYYFNPKLELISYNLDLKKVNSKTYSSEERYEKLGTLKNSITPNGPKGFILNRFKLKDNGKQQCYFLGVDNNLNTLWEFSSSLGKEENYVTPVTYINYTDQYFYNNIFSNTSASHTLGPNGGLMISNVQNGNPELIYNFDKYGFYISDAPALCSAGKEDVAYIAADYVDYLEKDRGLALVKMDVKSKKNTDKFISLLSVDFKNKLRAADKPLFAKKDVSIHPFQLVKAGDKLVMVGELYDGPIKVIAALGPQNKSTHIVICEFDKNLELLNIVLHPKKEYVKPDKVITDYKSFIDGGCFQFVKVKDDNSVHIFYLDYVSNSSVDFCIATYQMGNLNVKRKAMPRTANIAYTIHEGGMGKINIIKQTNFFVEVLSENY